MAVILDTSTMPVADRADAYDSVLNTAVFPTYAELGNNGPEPNARIEVWSLGSGVNIVWARMTGCQLRRSARQVKTGDANDVELGLCLNGTSASYQDGRVHRDREIAPIDAVHPYRVRFEGSTAAPSEAMCTKIDLDRLGVPYPTLRRAMPRLAASPVYKLFQSHMAGLPAAATEAEGTPAANFLGNATTELARALIASAANDDMLSRDTLANVISARLDAYIERHATDQEITPKQIAHEHGISTRYLYLIFARRGLSLEQQIIHHRLEHARRELALPSESHRTVEAIAYRAGFGHPQHFARRFRERYGLTPGEWRDMHMRKPKP
jgi:AraC-like DNA-binding protein